MRLPVFDYETNRIIPDATFTKEEYFNPTINRHFNTDNYNALADEGYISVKTIWDFVNDFIPHFNSTEMERSIGIRWGSSHHSTALYSPIYKAFFEALPNEHKYLIFYTTFRPHSQISAATPDTPWVYQMEAVVRQLGSVHYADVHASHHNVLFPVNLVGGLNEAQFSPDQMATLVSRINELPLDVIKQSFVSNFDTPIYTHDRWVPNLLKQMYKYAHNIPLFDPDGMIEEYSFDPEIVSAEGFADLLDSGIKINVRVFDDFSGIVYKEVPVPGVMNRRRYERIFNYSTDVLAHLPYSIKGPKEQTATLYGVELEANGEYSPKEIISAQKDLFFLLKQDSSITGMYQNCYEMVTVPCSLRAHKRLWAEFFESIDYKKFDTTKSTGNGMHVHIGRKVFEKTPRHLDRFTWFFIHPGHANFIYAMSERPTKLDMDRWSPIANVRQTGKIWGAARQASRLNTGRGAVHYKHNTVEIRIFKGIVSYATIVKNIEFVDSVVEFTRTCNTMQLTLRNYLAWVAATPKNKYELLKAYLSEIKVEKLLAPADLDQYLWGTMNNETLVTEKLNKAPFKVTNEHLTVLNKRRKKRTYILKDGVVQCIAKNTGALSKLDILAQKKQTRGSSTFLTAAL